MPNSFPDILKQALLEVQIPHPKGGESLTYVEYINLPDDQRGDDEQDVVDRLLTPRILACLGYEEADYQYNREKATSRPDFIIRPQARVAFFWEDKQTSLSLDPESEQIRRYTGSISPIGILFNGRELIAFQRERESLSVFLRVDLLEAYEDFGHSTLDFIREDAKEKLKLFHELFKKDRFIDINERLEHLIMSEEEWQSQARSIQEFMKIFIDDIQNVIDRLAHMAHSALEISETKIKEYEARLQSLREKWNDYLERSKSDLRPGCDAENFLNQGISLAFRLGEVEDQELQGLASYLRSPATQWSFLERLRQLNDEGRRLQIDYESYRSVHVRYAHWVELQRRFEEGTGIVEEGEDEELEFNRRRRFARQCAYVFFLKLLLVRILEDKGIIKPRLISDGGLEAWVSVARPRYTDEKGFAAIHLLCMALERASSHYGELRERDIYDWFMPDDLSILDVLETLAAYDFADLSTDLIGYTYQRFLERTERRRIGHYLTPPEVVDYILDEAGYLADNREIIGKKVIDPACGSGSFLVHAAYRYRKALETYYRKHYKNEQEAREKLAEDFLRSLQENFIGMDLNPFSCYLAQINLIIQALEDYHFLQSRGKDASIEGFKIYNTDSLVDYRDAELGEDLDEVRRLKIEGKGQFSFVFANPPYVTPKREDVGIRVLRDDPFYESWLSGDINTYIFFLRVGLHFLAPKGRLAYIVPLTSLGDQQSEALRRKLLTMMKPLAITRFYTEHVLFKGVDQAVTVLIRGNG